MTCLADQQSFEKLPISKKCSQTVLKLWLLNTARSVKSMTVLWQIFLVLNEL